MKKTDEFEVLNEWDLELKRTEKSDNTIKNYISDVYYFLKFIGWNGKATNEDVINYKKHLLKTQEPSTINRKLISIKLFLKFIGVESNVKQVKVQQKNTLENALTNSDYERIKRQAIKYKDEFMIMVLITLVNTGLRISEMLKMKVDDLKSNKLTVNNKGKIRYVPLRRELRKELKEYCNKNKIKGYIFCNRKGEQVSQVYIRKQLKLYGGKAKIKKSKVKPHNLRHLFAINFLETNNNIAELSNILGHSDIRTTSIYLKTSHQENVKKVERMKML